uniref:Hsp90 chaperone protein kinase-targeting subunit n=1 Tax=Eucampia antarctica TaxID=49252 RepID=A0A7S2S8D0_9STRA|eukprot:CAMPEP_0197831476 /NCGR_PEP_ID=MMETSP1437-20131217/10210_1 /TAXON_ID=49252 ORGANISM="Eucampia antarctica, Strain CCMP1452" /NCGR_SAMPLE_ID=MMETSP1437 /ASSEMBLY_ACC=CAM_ASM_001096 /LENGTH=438 /DNA_ID=CAMNT_0043434401 /DNA_START=35 /DNA_END=1351 /DNA_ORIENTATION=-
MSKGFSYSKWDNIELSDDEEDVHPNIDKESWFRLKHRSRVEREEKEEADKNKLMKEMDTTDLRIQEVTNLLNSLRRSNHEDDSDDELEDKEGLEVEVAALQKANDMRQAKLELYIKTKKWNVDNMCDVVEDRTIVNNNATTDAFTSTGYVAPTTGCNTTTEGAPVGKRDRKKKTRKVLKSMESIRALNSNESLPKTTTAVPTLSETTILESEPEESTKTAGPERDQVAMMSYHEFTEKYADLCEEFMKISSFSKCQEFLILNGNVMLQENASNYLLLASLEDEMNGFRTKMRQTARQSQIISNIAELAKSMQTHPGNVIIPFFKRLEQKEFIDGFMDGAKTFIDNIIKRAIVKKKEMDEERLKEEGEAVDLADLPKEERLGPNGLDPVEVFESLPESMQEAFESRDVNKLKAALLTMQPDEAEDVMKRCVDSGLWNEG